MNIHCQKKLFILNFLLIYVIFHSNAIASSCNLSLNVSSEKTVPLTAFNQYSGANCSTLEKMRNELFISKVSQISDKTFKTYKSWKESNNKIKDDLKNAIILLEKAKKSKGSETARKLAIIAAFHAAGHTLTILGCPAAATGVAAIACVGGIALTEASLLYGLTSSNFNEKVDQAIKVLSIWEKQLEASKQLGDVVLEPAKQAYLKSFDEMCSTVKSYCLK